MNKPTLSCIVCGRPDTHRRRRVWSVVACTLALAPPAAPAAQAQPDAEVTPPPAAAAESRAGVRLEVSFPAILRGPDPLQTRLDDPVWQIEGSGGNWLLLPLAVIDDPAATATPDPPRVSGARFVAWVLPDPQAAAAPYWSIASGPAVDARTPRAPEPTASEDPANLLAPLRDWARHAGAWTPPATPAEAVPNAAPPIPAAGPGADPSQPQPPRIATRLNWAGETVSYPLARGIRGLAVKAGDQPYLYKLDPRRLRDDAPQRPDIQPLDRDATRQERQNWARERTDKIAAFRQETERFNALRAQVQALPDPVEAPRPAGLWALYEVVGRSDAVSLAQADGQTWYAQADDLAAWRQLASGASPGGASARAGAPDPRRAEAWALVEPRVLGDADPKPFDQRLAVTLLAQSAALADAAGPEDPVRAIALAVGRRLSNLDPASADPWTRQALWAGAHAAATADLATPARSGRLGPDTEGWVDPTVAEPLAWTLLSELAADAPDDARAAIAAGRLAAHWQAGPTRAAPDLSQLNLDATQGVAAVTQALVTLDADPAALRPAVAAFDPVAQGWTAEAWAAAFTDALKQDDTPRAGLALLLDAALLPEAQRSRPPQGDAASAEPEPSDVADNTLAVAMLGALASNAAAQPLRFTADAPLWDVLANASDPALRDAAWAALVGVDLAVSEDPQAARRPVRGGAAPADTLPLRLAQSLSPDAPTERVAAFVSWTLRQAESAPQSAADAMAAALKLDAGPEALAAALEDAPAGAEPLPLAAAIADLPADQRVAAIDAWAAAAGREPHPVAGLAAADPPGVLRALPAGALPAPWADWAQALDPDPERAAQAASRESENDDDARAAAGAAARALLAGATDQEARAAATDWLAQPSRQGPDADAWWAERDAQHSRAALGRASGAYDMTLQISPASGDSKTIDLGLARWNVDAQGRVDLGAEGLLLRPAPGRRAVDLAEPVALKNLPSPDAREVELESAQGPLRLTPDDRGAWSGSVELRGGGQVELRLEPADG
ncbi:MAG: hypothetical protein AAGA57_05320 [Planctomycetota bacterium]